MKILNVIFLMAAPSAPAMDFLKPVEMCEKHLVSREKTTQTARETVQRAFERNQLAKIRFEGHLRDKVDDLFGLWSLPRNMRRNLKIRFEKNSPSLALLKPDGSAFYYFSIKDGAFVYWFDRRRMNGEAPEVQISDEVGMVRANGQDPDIKEYLSFRNLRGNRFLVTIGVQVPCNRTKEFRDTHPNSLVHVWSDAGKLCRVPIMTVNAH